MASKIWPFDTPGNYVVEDSDAIEVSGGQAQLKEQNTAGFTFNEDFASDAGFTYDSSKSEFVGGSLRQKAQVLTDAILGANYNTNDDANWGDGSLTGTAYGGSSVSGGKLVAEGSSNIGVYYDDASIGNLGNIFTLKFKYTPNYNTNNVVNTNIISLSPSAGNANRLLLINSPSGNSLRITAWNSAGSQIHNAQTLGAWTPVLGTEYEFELNVNTSTGLIRLFIDGVLFGSTPATVYTRGTTATRLYVGADPGTYSVANAKFDDVVVYSTVQHTTGYTPGYTVTAYVADTITLPVFTHSLTGVIKAISAFSTSDANSPRYIIGGMYWNGAAWVASDGTYAQANSEADVNTNIATLDVEDDTTLTIKVAFDAGESQMSVSDMTVTYSNKFYSTSYVYIEPASGFSFQTPFIEFSHNATIASGADISYAVSADDGTNWKYWDGSNWVDSDGTQSQSNDISTINANLNKLANSGTFKWRAFLKSDSLGINQTSIQDVTSEELLDIVTLTKVKTWLKISGSTEDDLLNDLIGRIQNLIETYTGREFVERTRTEYYDGSGNDTLILKHFPIHSITSLHDDPDRVFGSTDEIDVDADVLVDKQSGILRLWNGESSFYKGKANVKVVYVSGYSSVPQDIQHAAIIMVQHAYKRLYQDQRIGLQTETFGDRTFTYRETDIPVEAKIILDRYKVRIGTPDCMFSA